MKQSIEAALMGFAFSAVLALQPGAGVAGDTVYPNVDIGPEFNKKGELIQPEDFRNWMFIGAPLTPQGLNDGKA